MNVERLRQKRHAIKLMGEKGLSLNLAHGRLAFVKTVFVIAFVLVAARAADVSILKGVFLKPSPHGDVRTQESGMAIRGDILDRNGEILATTLKTASLYVDPKLISDPVQTAKELARIFPAIPYGKTLENLQGSKRFVWIKRGITPENQAQILTIGEPGLQFEYENKRFYPQGNLMPHMLGYTNVDGAGLAGVEKSFNLLLDSGKDLTLSIDMRLQHVVRREIEAAIKKFSAIGGAGVIMNVNTGEVLAAVSAPDYNPNIRNNVSNSQKFNRLNLGTYELGSVFKIFSVAAFLEKYDVPMSTTFDASEPIKSGRYTIRDHHAKNRVLTIPEIFMYSSNIGSAMMGQAVGDTALKNFYADLGLMDRLDIELPEKGMPLVPKIWREINTLTASYGHGIAVTPVHLASAVSSVVNGGFAIKPTVILSEFSEKKSSGISVMSAETSQKMNRLLRLVVTDGTARKAAVPGYRVGGKTGTAEKPGPKGYDKTKLISSFVGVFPMDDPQYVVFMMIDEPKGIKETYGYATAGWVAAPAVASVITTMGNILGVKPQEIAPEKDISHSLKKYVAVNNG